MSEYLKFWFAHFLVEHAFVILSWSLFIGIVLFFFLKHLIKEALCNHAEFHENRACHAICKYCSKDLGFVEISREHPKRKEV